MKQLLKNTEIIEKPKSSFMKEMIKGVEKSSLKVIYRLSCMQSKGGKSIFQVIDERACEEFDKAKKEKNSAEQQFRFVAEMRELAQEMIQIAMDSSALNSDSSNPKVLSISQTPKGVDEGWARQHNISGKWSVLLAQGSQEYLSSEDQYEVFLGIDQILSNLSALHHRLGTKSEQLDELGMFDSLIKE
jgi:hypothetical protein